MIEPPPVVNLVRADAIARPIRTTGHSAVQAHTHAWITTCRIRLEQMSFADEYAVTSSGHIFHHTQNAVGERFSRVRELIRRSVLALTDDDALAADPESWAEEIAAEFAAAPPTVDTAGHEFTQEGRVDVDCTNWPGIAFSTSEWGRSVVRAGHRFRVTVLGEGDLNLLKSRLTRGGTGRKVDLHTNGLSACTSGRRFGRQPSCRRTSTSSSLTSTPACRRSATRSPSATASSRRWPPSSWPTARRRFASRAPTSATCASPSPAAAPAPPKLHRPTLDEFYDHVVTVLGAVAVGFERSPRRFADAEEEALRDFILVLGGPGAQGGPPDHLPRPPRALLTSGDAPT
jgi:hypothetical protein